jgi:hypothetical protein
LNRVSESSEWAGIKQTNGCKVAWFLGRRKNLPDTLRQWHMALRVEFIRAFHATALGLLRLAR